MKFGVGKLPCGHYCLVADVGTTEHRRHGHYETQAAVLDGLAGVEREIRASILHSLGPLGKQVEKAIGTAAAKSTVLDRFKALSEEDFELLVDRRRSAPLGRAASAQAGAFASRRPQAALSRRMSPGDRTTPCMRPRQGSGRPALSKSDSRPARSASPAAASGSAGGRVHRATSTAGGPTGLSGGRAPAPSTPPSLFDSMARPYPKIPAAGPRSRPERL